MANKNRKIRTQDSHYGGSLHVTEERPTLNVEGVPVGQYDAHPYLYIGIDNRHSLRLTTRKEIKEALRLFKRAAKIALAKPAKPCR